MCPAYAPLQTAPENCMSDTLIQSNLDKEWTEKTMEVISKNFFKHPYKVKFGFSKDFY